MGQMVMSTNSGTSVPTQRENFRRVRHKRPMRRVKERYNGNGKGKAKVTILLMKNCGFCDKLKPQLSQITQSLKSNGVEVEVYDQAKNPKAFQAKAKEVGASGFPHASVKSASGKMGSVPGYMPAAAYVKKCMALV